MSVSIDAAEANVHMGTSASMSLPGGSQSNVRLFLDASKEYILY